MTLNEIIKKWLPEDELIEVESETQKGFFWHVKRIGNRWTCDCPGFKMNRFKCKHTFDVLADIYKNGGRL